ncbi:MAG: 2Fe-2S iron-sulfur cluster binding domain-containing protein [Myxococcales bacterium]|nr:2Fe-2S iron-sulfur cluster binding domain-containing protein [Myxococcales bacterium]
MAEIVFATAARRIVVPAAEIHDPEGTSLLAAVRHAGLPLGQSCRGEGVCRSCAVDIVAGADRLGPLTPLERRFKFSGERRLACQAGLPSAHTDVSVVVTHPAWGRPPPAEPAPDPAALAAAADVTLEP